MMHPARLSDACALTPGKKHTSDEANGEQDSPIPALASRSALGENDRSPRAPALPGRRGAIGGHMTRMLFVLGVGLLVASASSLFGAPPPTTPDALRKLAAEYYAWRDQSYPVASSDQGLHTWDDRLTDYSRAAIDARRKRIAELQAQIRGVRTEGWAKDDRVDWLLFRSQIDTIEIFNRVMDSEATDPQTYVGECSNAIFSLLKKDYAPPRTRALAATARLKAMPALLEQGKINLTKPVRLYARLAIDAARAIDPLFKESLMSLAGDLQAGERSELEKASAQAVTAVHGFADWLEKRLPQMVEFKPMGEANYNDLLKRSYLLPLDARQVEMLGQAELARYRALE